MYGGLSSNVAVSERNLFLLYTKKAKRAYAAHDLNRLVAHQQQALSHLREAARIYRAINHLEQADELAGQLVDVEEILRKNKAKQAAESRG